MASGDTVVTLTNVPVTKQSSERAGSIDQQTSTLTDSAQTVILTVPVVAASGFFLGPYVLDPTKKYDISIKEH